MKNSILFRLAVLIIFSVILYPVSAQKSSDNIKSEIAEQLRLFNTSAQNANTDQMMSLFDDSENILFIGSDSAEIWKGRDKIKGHLNTIFPKERVNLEMKRVEIDANGNTAWAFVDGYINITSEKGEKFRAPYRFTIIFVKKDSTWKIKLFDGSNPGGR
jgi:ketosteroid isomerase-like protein